MPSENPSRQAPPGWYLDPERPGEERYWDGGRWTDERRAADASGPPPPLATPQQPVYVERAANGFAVIALACGIIGAVLGLIPILFFLAWALGLVALTFGILGWRRVRREPRVGRRGMAIAGTLLGVLALGLGGLGFAIVNDAFEDLDEALEETERELDEAVGSIGAEEVEPAESSVTPTTPPSNDGLPQYRRHTPSYGAWTAKLPAGRGWSPPAESEPTPGELMRTTVNGPDGLLVIVDYTPFEPARFGGDYDSRREIAHPRFASATEFVFQGGVISECQAATCVDIIVNDEATGEGYGILVGGTDDVDASREIARRISQTLRGGAGVEDVGDDCTPGYEPCLPPASDYDCKDGTGDGPEYTGEVRVTGSDPYGLDADGNGVGCEGQMPPGPVR